MKTGTVINIACGGAREGKKVLYGINEDRPEDIIIRKVSNLSGMTKRQIHDNPQLANKLAYENGFGNITVISMSPGSLSQLESSIEKYQPDIVVVDQLRNLKVKADNRVNQLEYAATGVRNLGKAADVLMVSVTQAGDSADGKAVLEMGDVDFSNTGIPAQADLMLGVGVTPELEAEGLRVFSMPKNKISGDHGNFPVRVIPQLSRVVSA
jgi:KaiC/GvpD/RAD55 family RecA-like ATPase